MRLTIRAFSQALSGPDLQFQKLLKNRILLFPYVIHSNKNEKKYGL